MSKYKFSPAERWAIWKTHGPNCRWSNTPVAYSNCQIDHILPESLDSDPKKLEELVKLYKLHKDFKLNSFYNWIPIQPGVNQSKSKDVFDGAPFVGQLLHRVAAKFEEASKLHQEMLKSTKVGKLMAMLEVAVKNGDIKQKDVDKIFEAVKPERPPFEELTLQLINSGIFITPQQSGWAVVRTEGEQDYVKKGNMFGITAHDKAPDLSWLCGNCKHFGPWDGNRCLTCGVMSYPD